MNTVERQIVDVPTDHLSGVDQMFGRMMNMDIEQIPAKFTSVFEETRETTYRNFSMKGVYESYEIERIDEDSILLKTGITLESKLMAGVFRNSSELVFLVVSLHGYEALDEAEENMFRKLFLDSWGTAFIECGNKWVEQSIAKDLEDLELYTTHSFSPGQNDIPMDMQALIFQALSPQEIGVTLNEKYMMHPQKSVSGIFGIQKEKSENRIRPCDICERRDNCPTAYV